MSAPSCKPGATHDTDAKSAPLTHATESWCPEGFESGAADTCFAIPEKPAKDAPVLVYLHGMYEGHGVPAEWSAVHVAVDRGFAVVMPRGKRGLCAWRAELKDHFCWPQDPEDTGAMKSVVAEWDKALWQVEALLEPGTHKRYVLGSGSGGFFGAYLATHTGMFPGQAYAIVNGGPLGTIAAVPAPSAKPGGGGAKALPIELIAHEPPPEGTKMKDLHDALTKASMPHAWCARSGSDALAPDDVDTALKFFKHEADGTLKPQGTSYPCDPPPKK